MEQTEGVETIDVQARFDKSIRNYHVFRIKSSSEGITGGVYFDKHGGVIPDFLKIKLLTKADNVEETKRVIERIEKEGHE